MANTFVIACPDCAKQVKVSEEHIGKRIKCKGCGTIYPVTAPGESAPAAKPKGAAASAPKTKAAPPSAPKTQTAPPSAPKTQTAPPPKPAGDYEEFDPNDYSLAQTNDTLPRCPFCAQEMESSEALICLHCGYNTRTRTRPEVKAIYQATGVEIFLWLLPGILTVLVAIGMLVWYLVFWNLIEEWLADSWFEDEPGPPRTYLAGLGPGFMRLYHGLIILFLYVPMFRFAFKRLVKDNKPPERKIKEEW